MVINEVWGDINDKCKEIIMNYEDEQVANLILSLQSLKGVGSKTIQKILIEHTEKIRAVHSYTESFVRSFNSSAVNNALDKLEITWKDVQLNSANVIEYSFNHSIGILHPYMERYPKRLLALNNFPPILYVRGDSSLLNHNKVIAIIGTRKPTDFGAKMVHRLSKILSEDNYVVVSGLAIGCDTHAHRGSLSGNSKTIAVLPTALDGIVYPKENQSLAREIVDNGGLLVSEYRPGIAVKGRGLVSNLIARDEWQAGLSDGVIAAETSTTGGSNHAIMHAISTNKPLALFDYTSRLSDFFTNERYSGNVKYITNGEAMGLYSKESVEKFKCSVNEYHSNLKYLDLAVNKKNRTKLEKQQSLF